MERLVTSCLSVTPGKKNLKKEGFLPFLFFFLLSGTPLDGCIDRASRDWWPRWKNQIESGDKDNLLCSPKIRPCLVVWINKELHKVAVSKWTRLVRGPAVVNYLRWLKSRNQNQNIFSRVDKNQNQNQSKSDKNWFT